MTAFIASVFFVMFWDMNNLWHPYLKFKPFNCVPCLSVWVCLIMLFLPNEWVEISAYCFGAGVIAPLLKYYLQKL